MSLGKRNPKGNAAKCFQIDPRDNVLVALRRCCRRCCRVVAAPCPVTRADSGQAQNGDRDLAPGDLIRMYGMVVGEATAGDSARRADVDAQRAASRRGLHGGAPAGVVCPARCLGMDRAHIHGLSIAPTARWARGITGSCCRWSSARTATWSGCAKRWRKSLATAARGTAIGSYVRATGAAAGKRRRSHTADDAAPAQAERVFPNVDGIRFLTHQGGCGGTRQDAQALCGLLAGYIHHPNVAGATVLSLGCQNAQAACCWTSCAPAIPRCASRCWSSISSGRAGRPH